MHGLTTDEAHRRLEEYGPNELARGPDASRWRAILDQLRSPMIWLLGAAAVVSLVLGETADAAAIAGILLANAVVGHVQEQRAARAIHALRTLTAPRAAVLRDGHQIVVPAALIVPGDVLVLAAGDIVAADGELLEAHALTAVEAALTGESAPVYKRVGDVDPAAALAEQRGRVFQGTSIAAGSGRARVIATGMATELGRIATLLASTQDEQTPLQRRLARVTRTLLLASGAIVAVVALVGVARGAHWFDVFLSGVALAVAAMPEGLPAVITVALALGVRRMAARHALIRKLPAVETLGCATVICTDKTGTLTTGVMTVRELWGADRRRLLDAATACCEAGGDPTEEAIVAAAADLGIARDDIERTRPRVHVTPFDPDARTMAIQRADGVVYVKGAPEVVLARCSRGADGAAAAAESLARRGLRVLAVAVGADEHHDLELVGLVGSADPPRREAIAAVAAAKAAGVRTVMITGDHPATAEAIAHELGIGIVHARATPEDKLRIVRAEKARDEVVVMTGDGVNDAPALREAHVGVAMGSTATDVTREVSDVVLADDNYASIVAAIREGRAIFENLRKVLVYLLTGNVAELAVMLVAALAGLPLPLLPLQLLWINLVTDGLPALALVRESPEADVMENPPRSPSEALLGGREWLGIVLVGVLEAALALGAFIVVLETRPVAEARAYAFGVLVASELLRAAAARSTTRVLWQLGVASNLALLGVVVTSLVACMAVFPMPLADWAVCGLLALVPVTALEVTKLLRRARQRRPMAARQVFS